MCWVVLRVMIKAHRRWLLPAILGCAVLLLASTGLFLLLHPTASGQHHATRSVPDSIHDTDSFPDTKWRAVE